MLIGERSVHNPQCQKQPSFQVAPTLSLPHLSLIHPFPYFFLPLDPFPLLHIPPKTRIQLSGLESTKPLSFSGSSLTRNVKWGLHLPSPPLSFLFSYSPSLFPLFAPPLPFPLLPSKIQLKGLGDRCELSLGVCSSASAEIRSGAF